MNGGDIERNDGLRSASSFLGDDSHIGGSSTSLDTVRPDENLRSPYRHPPLPRHPNLPRNNGLRSASSFLGDDLHIGRFGGSSSSLDTIGPPIIAVNVLHTNILLFHDTLFFREMMAYVVHHHLSR